MLVRRGAILAAGWIFAKLSASGLLTPGVDVTSDMITEAVTAIALVIASIAWSLIQKWLDGKDIGWFEAIKNLLSKTPAA